MTSETMAKSAFLLKASDGAEPPTFTTVAGLRVDRQSITDKAMSIAGTGIFTGYKAKARVETAALSGSAEEWSLSFDTGDQVSGRFLITRLDYAGEVNGERTYTLAMESIGKPDSTGPDHGRG